jgi:aldehyde dehydrogenase (NAD+)
MRESLTFYIGGRWYAPSDGGTIREHQNPATELVCGSVALGCAADIEKACEAARYAFASWSCTSRDERLRLLGRIASEYEFRALDLAAALSEEMGSPTSLARAMHVPGGLRHLRAAMSVLETFPFEERREGTTIVREPIGVCGLITPWNWPLSQIMCKVAPALATGCTMVLKPSEMAPFSGRIFAEILHAAGVPAGVFNMVQGEGPTVGAALAGHREVDMVSFTGSTQAGATVARIAAGTVKRVAQELGGKSPNIIIDDASFGAGVESGVSPVMLNSGQSCNAPTRMLVPKARMREAADIAREAVLQMTIGAPDQGALIGPVASSSQFDRIQGLIAQGIEEGAELVSGGLGRPERLERGFYVKPTIFAHVVNDMNVAREEVFGPVLAILGYENLEDAIRIANDTDYGLAAYVHSADPRRARAVAQRLRAGQVSINGARDIMAPFGGYKMSGNGREYGFEGFSEFLETKAIIGEAVACFD